MTEDTLNNELIEEMLRDAKRVDLPSELTKKTLLSTKEMTPYQPQWLLKRSHLPVMSLYGTQGLLRKYPYFITCFLKS